MERILSLLAVVTLLLPREVAANCAPEIDRSIAGEFRSSAYVALVRVDRVAWLDESRKPVQLRMPLALGTVPGGFDPYSGAYYDARPLRMFKGRPVRSLRIWSENMEARTPLAIGKDYLVFLYRNRIRDGDDLPGDLMIDYCGNSAPAAASKPTIRVIERLQWRQAGRSRR